jgi:hypothetical protein
MLTPLRAGNLLLPTVGIRPISAANDMSGAYDELLADQAWPDAAAGSLLREGAQPQAPMTCETHNRSRTQTVLVRPDIKSTTVRVDAGKGAAAAVLVDVEHRIEAAPGGSDKPAWLRASFAKRDSDA